MGFRKLGVVGRSEADNTAHGLVEGTGYTRKPTAGRLLRLQMRVLRLTATAPRGGMPVEERMLNRTLIAVVVLAASSVGCTAVNAQL
ncbi:MAG: hypothetical protein ACJAZO_002176, partial [Myxococcota bacterium]